MKMRTPQHDSIPPSGLCSVPVMYEYELHFWQYAHKSTYKHIEWDKIGHGDV